jgi:hypothetical protein
MSADKKAFPLRINANVLDAMQRWADDELRSVNAQIEFVLRQALYKNGRLKPSKVKPITDDDRG